ncbi:MAG: hypothetical protein CVV27_00095 [Candidatus Melainabacteria bacterium HGW-Melainabacteria-1]|nr:MAG: hypothetical protein CVV27_00095 [Candidatus Melainabacteria bacterium HGW-Melainabacteria-1]
MEGPSFGFTVISTSITLMVVVQRALDTLLMEKRLAIPLMVYLPLSRSLMGAEGRVLCGLRSMELEKCMKAFSLNGITLLS